MIAECDMESRVGETGTFLAEDLDDTPDLASSPARKAPPHSRRRQRGLKQQFQEPGATLAARPLGHVRITVAERRMKRAMPSGGSQ